MLARVAGPTPLPGEELADAGEELAPTRGGGGGSPGSFGRGARHPSSSAPKHLCAIDLP